MYNYCVYILKCSDGSFYTGITNNIQRRLQEHESRFDPSCYTASRLPVTLVFQQCFDEPNKAIAFEKQVKGWSRAKKLALINGDFDPLPESSKNRQGD